MNSRTISSRSRPRNTFRSIAIRKNLFLSVSNANAITVAGPALLSSLTRTNTSPVINKRTLSELNNIRNGQAIESARKIIDPQLLTLEHEYPDSRAFYAGTCHLCPLNSCTRINGFPCLHPQEIRPSLESVGFDIGKTVSELLHIELQWSNDARLPEYLTLVSGLFTKESIYAPISTRISSLLTV